MLEIKKEDYLFNYFDSISDLNTWIKSTPRRKKAEKDSEREGNDFCDTYTLKEAMHKMVYTDHDLYKKFLEFKRDYKGNLAGEDKRKNQLINNVIGFTPNVPNYILGIPQDMINNTQVPTKTKILNLAILGSVSAFCPSNELNRLGLTVATVIDKLEKQGYRCNLYLIYGVEGYGTEKSLFCLKLKSDCEPLNMKKLVFPICSSSMFRRIGFYWIEASNMSEEPTRIAYGHPIENKNYIKSQLDDILKLNAYVFNFQNNRDITVDGFLKRLENDGVVLH